MPPTTLRLPFAVGSAVLLLALSACGGSDGSTASGGQAADPAAGQSAPPAGDVPGASGTVAAVSGTTMQVQSEQSGQVAVTWTAKTSFTQQVKASLSDVRKGGCVVVTAAGGDGATADSSTVQATTVQISKAAKDGTCAAGFAGGRRGGSGGARPSDAPTDLPSGAPSGRGARGFGGGAFGQVTSVTAAGFTVASSRPGGSSAASTKVTVSSATTYSTTAKATAAAVRTGDCATAVGESDSTGAITARQVSVTLPVDGRCGMGFPGGPGAGQGS